MAVKRGSIWYLAVVFFVLVSFSRGVGQNIPQTRRGSGPASISSLWPSWPKARTEDVQSAQSIVSAYFEVLSGKATTERDWDRFKSLFLPDGRVIDLKTWNDPHLIPATFDLDRLIETLKVNLRKADFEERPVDVHIETSSNLVHAYVSSEVYIGSATARPSAHSVYSFELARDVDRYWITEVTQQQLATSSPR